MNQKQKTTPDDLRQLEAKLRSASVAKANALTCVEHQAQRVRDQKADKVTADNVCKVEVAAKVNDRKREQEALDRKHEYRDSLLKQISDNAEQKKKLHDKNYGMVVPKFDAELDNDPQVQHELKLLKQADLRTSLDASIKMKSELKEQMKMNEFKEDILRNEFVKNRDEVEDIHRKKVKDDLESQINKKSEIGKSWILQQDRNSEREKLIAELLKDERKDFAEKSNTEHMLANLEKRIKMRKDLLQQIEERIKIDQMKMNEQKKEQELMRAELAKEQELERQLKEEEKRKQLEYGRCLQTLVAENDERKKKEISARVMEEKLIEEEQKQKANLLEQERIRLLEKNVNELRGYLPSGILKQEDLALLHPKK